MFFNKKSMNGMKNNPKRPKERNLGASAALNPKRLQVGWLRARRPRVGKSNKAFAPKRFLSFALTFCIMICRPPTILKWGAPYHDAQTLLVIEALNSSRPAWAVYRNLMNAQRYPTAHHPCMVRCPRYWFEWAIVALGHPSRGLTFKEVHSFDYHSKYIP